MVGFTTKGHLVKWDVERELHRQPNPQMLVEWLKQLPQDRGRQKYGELLRSFPLLYNAQDSHGKTLLMVS